MKIEIYMNSNLFTKTGWNVIVEVLPLIEWTMHKTVCVKNVDGLCSKKKLYCIPWDKVVKGKGTHRKTKRFVNISKG